MTGTGGGKTASVCRQSQGRKKNGVGGLKQETPSSGREKARMSKQDKKQPPFLPVLVKRADLESTLYGEQNVGVVRRARR